MIINVHLTETTIQNDRRHSEPADWIEESNTEGLAHLILYAISSPYSFSVSNATLRHSETAAIRRGCVTAIRLNPDVIRSCGSCVDLPHPVSPAMTTAWELWTASVMSAANDEIGSAARSVWSLRSLANWRFCRGTKRNFSFAISRQWRKRVLTIIGRYLPLNHCSCNKLDF